MVGVGLAAGCRTTQETAVADPYGAYGNQAGGDYGGYASQETDYVQVTPTGQAGGSGYGQGAAWGGGVQAGAAPQAQGGYPAAGYADPGPQSQGSTYASAGGAAAVSNTVSSPPSSYSAPPSGRTYTVQKGDTLFRIGRNHGTSVDAIVAANAISGTTIYPGQVLTIP
jgi:LysM repeat protein